MLVTVVFHTPVALVVSSTRLVFNLSSKNFHTFSILYFNWAVNLTPCPGLLATLCVGLSDEVVDCGSLL